MRGSTPMDMVVVSVNGHATQHYGVREYGDFSNNEECNGSYYLNGADMTS